MLTRWLAIFLFAVALTGAPFGMGRMMDTEHASVMHDAHAMAHHGHRQPDAGHIPGHDPAAPHFAACAACAAHLPLTGEAAQIAVLSGALQTGTTPRLSGIPALPDLPPPRA